MAQSERTIRLLEIVDTLLTDFGEPLYYKELCKVLIDSGLWADPWGQQPDQILYSAIHNDIKKCGNGRGRFLFMGEGVFCSTTVDGVQQLVEEKAVAQPANNVSPRDPYRRTGDMPGDADRRREQAEWDNEHRKCWNCSSMSFEGPNAHTHETGTCNRYVETGRPCVWITTPACELWRARTPAQREQDRMLPGQLIVDGLTALYGGDKEKAKARAGR